MPNVVTSLARKLRTGHHDPAPAGRHRREGWFDETDTWHDAETPAARLVEGTAS